MDYIKLEHKVVAAEWNEVGMSCLLSRAINADVLHCTSGARQVAPEGRGPKWSSIQR